MRAEKTAIVNEIKGKVSAADFLILTNYKGIKVSQVKELRKRLAARKTEFHVVKNSFLKKAVEDLPRFKIEDELNMPLAMVVGRGEGIDVAKTLEGFKKEQNVTSIVFGFLDGRRFSAAEFGELIKLPSRATLLAMLACAFASPMSSLATVMHKKVSGLVYALRAVQELKEKSGK